MNRRQFAITASASLAMVGIPARAQRNTAETVVTSELTGAEINLADAGIFVEDHSVNQRSGFERFQFLLNGGLLLIEFYERGSQDLGAYVDSIANDAIDMFTDFEEQGSDTYDDGGWISFSHDIEGTHYLQYHEYQLGAFPEADLVILFSTPTSAFIESLDIVQSVQIEGMPPFLFTEDSQIATIAQNAQSTTATGRSRTGRNQTSTSGSTGNTTETRGRNRQGRDTTGTTGMADPVAVVNDHRTRFLDSFDEFFEVLEEAADETTPDIEVVAAWDELLRIAGEWKLYATEAAEVQFAGQMADLEEAYIHWADCITDMGEAFENYADGYSTVDDFLAVYDTVIAADTELETILQSYDQQVSRGDLNKRAIAASLTAVDRTRLAII